MDFEGVDLPSLCTQFEALVRDHGKAQHAIDELKAENAHLKAQLENLDDKVGGCECWHESECPFHVNLAAPAAPVPEVAPEVAPSVEPTPSDPTVPEETYDPPLSESDWSAR